MSQKKTGFDFLEGATTTAGGTAALRFERRGSSAGDVVTLDIELVVMKAEGDFDDFTVESISRWAMSSTPAPVRSSKIQM